MNKLEIFHRTFLNIDFWSALSGFIGTLLIFFFGLPPKIDLEGHMYLILEQENKKDKRKRKKYKKKVTWEFC